MRLLSRDDLPRRLALPLRGQNSTNLFNRHAKICISFNCNRNVAPSSRLHELKEVSVANDYVIESTTVNFSAAVRKLQNRWIHEQFFVFVRFTIACAVE